MELLEKLLTLSVGGITVGAVVVYLGKLILDKSSAVLIEDYKNKLEMLKIEHQIRFTKLYEERGEVIKTVYQSLYELEHKLEYLTSPFQGPEWKHDLNREKEAIDHLNKTSKQLEINRIFFNESLCNEIASTLNDCRDVIIRMKNAKENSRDIGKGYYDNSSQKGEKRKTPTQIWIEAQNKVKNEIKNQRLKLAQSFRDLIGVEK
jgi:hypothetical protein